MQQKDILDLSTTIGYLMLGHGAETYRVEETIRRIGEAYGMASVDAFAIPTSLVVTVTDEDHHDMTKSKRVSHRDIDFDKVERLNALSRKICATTPDAETVRQEIDAITSRKAYGIWLQMLGCAIVAFSFTLLFGGTLTDALFALGIGVVLRISTWLLGTVHPTGFFINIVGGAVASILAVLAVRFTPAEHLDKIIIGVIMILVPGLAITNAMQDFFAGDTIAGLTKLVEALLVATGIAVGTALILGYVAPMLGVM